MPVSTHDELTLQRLVQRDARPFPLHPVVERYFPAASIENARQRISRAIVRGEGPGLVVGSAGLGKSLLLQVLAAQFQGQFDVVFLGCARVCSRRALLQAILFELDLPFQERDEGRLRFMLLDHLLASSSSSSPLLLLVDEAQTLSCQLLDELRVLTNLVHGGVPRVRLVIAGAASLEETFASPELESLSQRLAARSYLAPFSRSETAQYVRAQLAASRAAVQDVLGPDACDAVFEATDGVPRLVNQLCDRAVYLAVTQGRSKLDRGIVQQAWSDLQQLPSPWQSTAETPDVPSGVVEFGSLSADPSIEAEPEAADAAAASNAAASPQSSRPLRPRELIKTDPLNPFSEEFDEDELVIDGFSPLVEPRSLGTPRVENLRDPAFAKLLQSALDSVEDHVAEDVPARTLEARAGAPTDAAPSDTISREDSLVHEVAPIAPGDDAWSDLDERLDELDPHWPPIRLPFPTPVEAEGALHQEADWDKPFSPQFSSQTEGQAQEQQPEVDTNDLDANRDLEGDPVLIVEEDAPRSPMEHPRGTPRPQVRRQEYRRLFSRLRSG